jgi:hypothetical protein
MLHQKTPTITVLRHLAAHPLALIITSIMKPVVVILM